MNGLPTLAQRHAAAPPLLTKACSLLENCSESTPLTRQPGSQHLAPISCSSSTVVVLLKRGADLPTPGELEVSLRRQQRAGLD